MDREELDSWEAILADPAKPKQERLKAYCVLFTYRRRSRDLGDCLKLHRKYEDDFKDTFFYHHLYAIALKESGRRRDIDPAVESARSALALAPDNVGALHSLASALYLSAQAADFKAPDCDKKVGEALELVDEAICIEGYAKFYSTKAQILSAKGLPDLASDAIREAIEREDSRKKDYHLRLSDYFSVRSQIELRKRIREATEYADATIKAALDDARRSNLEILSFFIAAVSFIIAGINITVKLPAADVAGLIFILSAAMLISVSGFALFYGGYGAKRRFSVVFAIGLLMAGAGLLFRWLWRLNV